MNGNELVRYTEWRPVPGRSYRLGSHLSRQIRRVRWFGWVCLLVAFPLFVFALIQNIAFMPGLIQMATMVGFLSSIRYGNVFRFVAPDPLPPDHFPVFVTMFVDGFLFGRQEGLLVLDDQWMLFEGDECSFALRRDQLAVALGSISQPFVRAGFRVPVFVPSPSGGLSASGIVLNLSQLQIRDLHMPIDALERRFLSWANSGGTCDGVPTLPPLALHPFFAQTVAAGERLEITVFLLAGLAAGMPVGWFLRGQAGLLWGILVFASIAAVSAIPFRRAHLRNRATKKLAGIAAQAKVIARGS